MIYDKKKWKVLVSLCIVLVVAGIWMLKNASGRKAQEQVPVQHEDFVLEARAIDLDALTAHGLPIIIDFGADWCGPCREFEPVLRSMHEQMQGLAIIKYVDVDESGEAAADFPVQVIPTQVFIMPDGKPYLPGEDITAEFVLYNHPETDEHVFTVHQGALTEKQMRVILTDMGANP